MTSPTPADVRPDWSGWVRWPIVLVPGLLWWVACLPGNLTFDSIGSLNQIATGEYWNNHPVAYTLALQVLTLGGSAIWVATLVQSVGLATGLYALGRSLGGSRNLAAIVAGVVMVTPWAGPFAVTVWKDVPYAIGLVWGITLAVAAARSRRWWSLAGATALIAVASSFRHNGWPVDLAAAAILAVLLLVRRAWGSGARIVLALVVGGIASIALQQAAVVATGARTLDPWFTYQTVLADLAYADVWHPEQMPAGLHEFVTTFATGEAYEGARECSVLNRLVYGDGFDVAAANTAFAESLRWYKELALTSPQYIVQARACRAAAMLPPPLSTGPKYIYINELSVYPNELGIERWEVVPPLASAAVALDGLWVSGGRILAWPGLLALLGTIALYLRARRRPERFVSAATWFAITWGTVGVITLVSVAQDFRYGAVPALVALVVIGLWAGEALGALRNRGARSAPARPSPAETSPSAS